MKLISKKYLLKIKLKQLHLYLLIKEKINFLKILKKIKDQKIKVSFGSKTNK